MLRIHLVDCFVDEDEQVWISGGELGLQPFGEVPANALVG